MLKCVSTLIKAGMFSIDLQYEPGTKRFHIVGIDGVFRSPETDEAGILQELREMGARHKDHGDADGIVKAITSPGYPHPSGVAKMFVQVDPAKYRKQYPQQT
jgi:hypothetical protein